VIKVELSSWQKVIYNNIGRKGSKEIDDTNQNNKENKKAMMNLMMQLRKICNHPFLFLTNYEDLLHNETIMRSSGKF
jgi:ATP-dependent helicase STH1/SNF2